MEIIVLNDNAGIDGLIPKEAEWCVYWYESGSYEGNGEAFAGNSKGEYWIVGLGHCSCFGPGQEFNGGNSVWDKLTLADLKMNLLGNTNGIADKIKEKKWADI